MEGNVCDVNHLDSDVLLPPRKRLLACLKKQNSDVNGNSNANSNSNSISNSQTTCNPLNELDARLSYLLKAHLTNDNPSQEEIVAASRTAAEVAAKVAMAARATAQEKAIIASKAMAVAKKALEFVANLDNNHEKSSSAEEQLEKNKSKKQVEVQMSYNNKTNDEELARKLHQAINSSPRISKSGVPSSDVKSPKHKKLKTSINVSENGTISNTSIVNVGKSTPISPSINNKQIETVTKSNMENRSKLKSGDEDFGRKRGRMKQKKLPLSICHDRDQANPKEDVTSRSPLSVGPAGSSGGPLWKCQAFKAPVCVKQNKVMQS